MHNPALDVLALPAVAIEETLHQPADLSPDHFRNIFCQQDIESALAEIKSPGAQRFGKRISLRGENLRPGLLLSAADRGCGAVPQRNPREQVAQTHALA